MKRLLPLCALLCATLPAFAFIDTNNNGLSDLWERTYNNGQLFGLSFDLQADADGDGWTNAQEAAAGTNPFDPNPPEGIVRPQLTNIPAVWSEPDENGDSVIVTPASMFMEWQTIPGKQYTLLYSPDLIDWLAVPNETFIGSGSIKGYGVELTDDKLFWRVKIEDVDSDGNGLTDAEEQVLGIATGFTDANNNGIPDVWETQNSGSFAVYPPYLAACLSQNQTAQQSILLRNDTGAAVNYTVALSGTTGPAYSFGDSVTGNVEYTWEDVSATGTLLADISDADDAFEAVAISGFTFPFYGQNFSQVFVSSNGFLTFGTGSDAHYNTTLPSISAPANLIAPLWDDLDTRGTGDIYYKQESDRLIIQYQNVGRYGGTSTYTFQVVLFSDGRMQFRYHTLSDVADSCTVGIQNPMQTIGVQIVSSASYLASQMAIEIRPYSEFFTIDPASGVVPANSVSTLTGLFRSLAIPPAVYYANLSLSHDGAGSSPCEIPIRFAIRNLPSTVALTSPANSLVILEGQSISLHANASDPEGLARVEFLDGTTSIGEVVGNSNSCSLVYATPPVGTRYLIARAIDAYGAATNSAVIQVVVRADTDRDGMPDDWEIANGFNPVDAADASTDADGDGYTNIEEFQFGKDPHLVEDGDSDGMPDGWEYHNGLNLASDDASGDFDQDGLTNLQEYQAGTKANKADTDGDLIPDGWEVANGLNPLDPSDALLDNDTGGPDGLCNLDEYRYNTDPHNRDTDGDGVLDGQEANGPDGNPATDDGSDPTDPTDNGVRLPAVQLVTFNLGVGDRSGSASEDYVLNVFRLSPSDGSEQRIFTLRSGGFGQYTTQTKSFKKGETYTFQIQWIGTSRTLGPDWDYHLVVAPQGTSTGGILLDSYDPATKQLNNSIKLLDPQDINPGDDDDDDVVDFSGTLQLRRVVFKPFVIQFIEPDDPTWMAVMSENKVVLDDKNLRIKIVLSNIQSVTQETLEVMGLNYLHLNTTATCPVLYTRMKMFGPSTILYENNGSTEIRIELSQQGLRLAMLLPELNADETYGERACLDHATGNNSNFSDSESFIQPISAMPELYRGYARNEESSSLECNPFRSKPDITFIQSAGAEMLTVKVEGTCVQGKAMLMNQADVFYFSGHGITDVGNYTSPGLIALEGDESAVTAYDLSPYWGRDLDCAVFAGCAVLNINNWVAIPAYVPPTIGPGVGYWPGKIMENIGPPFLVGYGALAPSDNQGTAAIASSFISQYDSSGDPFASWRDANDNSNGRNAVAIQREVKYGYFLRSEFLGIPYYTWTEKAKVGDWDP